MKNTDSVGEGRECKTNKIRLQHGSFFLARKAREATNLYVYWRNTEQKPTGYRNIDVGGMVPRIHDKDFVISVARGIAALKPDLIHVFGIGEPSMVQSVIEAGATSTDSSAYVRAAADGKKWGGEKNDDPSVFERVKIALDNLQSSCLAASSSLKHR